MASRLYFNTARYYINQYAHTSKSAVLPVGTLKDLGSGGYGFVPARGYASGNLSETSDSNACLAQTGRQDIYYGKWITPNLAMATVEANTWTVAIAYAESNANANFQAMFVMYVLKTDDTTRGMIYDSSAALGVEYSLT